MNEMQKGTPDFKEELIADEGEQRNWKGILIALLVIGTICSFIVLSIVILTPNVDLNSQKLKLEDYIYEGYEIKEFNGSWISEDEIIYMESTGAIIQYNLKNNQSKQIAPNITVSRVFKVEKFSISADRRYIMFTHELAKTGSYSYKAKYQIYDTFTRTLNPTPLQAPDGNHLLQYAGWGPNSNQLIIVYDNNLIYQSHVGSKGIQITNNGKENFVYNGIPDILYEEHILKSNLAFWWYKDGTRLSYISFDNSRVDQIPYMIYGAPNTSLFSSITSYNNEYPKVVHYPYPKPGKINPQVIARVVDIGYNVVSNHKQITPPKEIAHNDYYITAPIVWISNTKICVIWSTRSQNLTVVSICKEENYWQCEKVLEEQTTEGWLLIDQPPIFSYGGEYFFIILPMLDTSKGKFNQIAMVETKHPKKQFLTSGEIIVTKLISHRHDINTLYFIATLKDDPGQRHMYSITDLISKNSRTRTCLSCNNTEDCLYHDALFSPNGHHYILQCLGPGYPRYELKVYGKNETIPFVNVNQKFQKWLKEKELPVIKYLTVALESGHNSRVEMTLPHDINEEDDAKYPSIIHLNGIPGSQSVSYLNKLDWARYLTSRKDFISIYIDVRGSGFQGDKYMHAVYQHLGEIETQDIIETIKFLKEKLPYIAHDKIAIWGHGYGGFLTASLLTPSDTLFSCAVAVSPITNLRNYLSVFSERYMGKPMPQDNYVNYQQVDLVRKAENLKKWKGKFLLVHGTSDQLINIQHSMLFMKSLTEHQIQFRSHLYPDCGSFESWSPPIRIHFYKLMDDFISKCFKGDEQEDEEIFVTKVIKGGRRKD